MSDDRSVAEVDADCRASMRRVMIACGWKPAETIAEGAACQRWEDAEGRSVHMPVRRLWGAADAERIRQWAHAMARHTHNAPDKFIRSAEDWLYIRRRSFVSAQRM